MHQLFRFYVQILLLVLFPVFCNADILPAITNKPIESFQSAETLLPALVLTEKEHAWLVKHPIIHVGVTRDFPPYEWIDEHGHYVGPVAEYMRLLEKQLGVKFEIVHDRPWTDILEMAKNGKLDMLSCVNMTPERSKYLTFTEPYKSTHIIIIDNAQGQYIGNLEQLEGKRVAVEKDYFMQEFVEKNHPNIDVIAAVDTQKALDLVVRGAADAYVGDAGTANFFIRKGALFSLRFSGQTEYDSKYRIAISKAEPELVSILDKTMASIPRGEIESIFNRWLGLKIEQGVRKETLVVYGATFLSLFVLFAVWLFRLQMEIKKRKKIEASLEKNNFRFKTILDNIFAYVGLLDTNGVLQEVNKAPLDGTDLERQDVIGRNFADTPWWSYDEKIQAELRSAIEAAKQGEIIRYDVVIQKGANYVPLDFQISPVRDDSGNIIALLPTAVDISQRKQAEELIKHAEFLKDQALDLAKAGHWFINFDEGEEYYTSSERVVEIFGDPLHEDMRYHILNDWYVNIEAVDKSIAEATLQNYISAVEGTTPRYDMIHPYRRPMDGKIIWIHVLGHVVRDIYGNATHVYGVVMDITENKMAEIAIEESQKIAETAARSKSEFLANMSHEIRTPLNAIIGLAKISIRDHKVNNSIDNIIRIQEASIHLLNLVNDILDFSKIEAGKMSLDVHPFRLASLVQDVLNLIDARAKEKHLNLTLEIRDTLPEWVMGDSLRLRQILLNFLSNAVKFTEHGAICLAITREINIIVFTVSDSGIGMTPEQVSRLFTAFEQADSSTTRQFGGSGLGLAISQNLAHLMDGEITVKSEFGAGSQFVLKIPLAETTPGLESLLVCQNVGNRLQGLRILAAEDVALNRIVLEDMLTHEGAHVLFAENGQQVIDRLEETGYSDFDIVLMDIQMPVMDGYQATREILKQAKDIPIIGLTAHAMPEERQRCLDVGMRDRVTKPIDDEVLITTILKHVSNTSSQCNTVQVRSILATEASENAIEGQGIVDLVSWPAVLQRYDGRHEFVSKLINNALQGMHQESVIKLRQAAMQQDYAAVKFIAHSLKGIAGVFESQSFKLKPSAETTKLIYRHVFDAA